MTTVGMTALVPSELIFACEKKPCDVNNFVPRSRLQPANKLCSWTAIWRDIAQFEKSLNEVEEENVDCSKRVALLGVPPIYLDFHEVLESLGLHVVYDELPYEFARLSGGNIDDLAKNYSNYTFARNLDFRLNFLVNAQMTG